MHTLCRCAAMRPSPGPAGAQLGAAMHHWSSTRSKGARNRHSLERPVRRSVAPLVGLTSEQFYDPSKVAIIPIAFCYPGKAASGDKAPRPECAPRWHGKLNSHLPDIGLTLLIGQYAQAYYLGRRRKTTLRDTVLAWKEYLPIGYLPLVHPSPRNQPWLDRNLWFEGTLVCELRNLIQDLKL